MYNPSEVGKKGSIFGFPYSETESDLILLPVYLDITVSYADGTARAPDLILEESSQLDLSLLSIEKAWEMKTAIIDGIGSFDENEKVRSLAKKIIDDLEEGNEPSVESLKMVNEYCDNIHGQIENQCIQLLRDNKLVGLVGGDHSSPLGLIKALAKDQEFGILQIDAHMDLRKSYEGFTYSHASIMYNALKEQKVVSLTQVGIRDFCEEEENFIKESEKKINVFYDEYLFRNRLDGNTWKEQVQQIIHTLPENVYVSFDVDGLSPSLCPKTGTPVPGGLGFNETIYMIEEVVRSGKKIIGFDLCETGNDSWDANVGARILYRLTTALGASQGLMKLK